MIFEPTGDLLKDYCAFCEIDQLNERDDILDGIFVEEGRTIVRIRNIECCLNKRDAAPLCSGIPHCTSLTSVEMTGCGLTDHSLKLVTEALYKSPSVTSFAADFNANGILKDPTTTKKDKNEVLVFPSQYKGAHLRNAGGGATSDSKDDSKKKDPKSKAVAANPKEAAASDPNEKPLSLPPGWQSLLLTGLQVVSLRGNAIDDIQAESIALQLASNTELLSLNLWGNKITNVGAAALGKALQSNRRLTALDLGHNEIDDDGVLAVMQCFLTQDLTNDEALKMRQRVCGWTAELPIYPTYGDLVSAFAQPLDDKKDAKKKETKKKGTDGPVERLKGEFDKDCVRLDEQRIRIPGNASMWCINFSQNTKISPRIVGAIEGDILKRREPSLEEIYNGGNVKEPSPYLVSIGLRHVIIEHTKMDRKYQEQLNALLQQVSKVDV